MGRLSDYINSMGNSRHRSAYASPVPSRASGAIEVSGLEAVEQMFDRLLTSDPEMNRLLRRLIGRVMREARNRISKDVAGWLNSDPRRAARAVKHVVYKRLLGGNVSILAKRRASNERATLTRHRKLDENPKQWGGNRRSRDKATDRIDQYYGSDRGFILRFLNSGTDTRETRYGNRGSLRGGNFFGRIAPWHLEKSLEEMSEAVAEYIDKMK